MTVSMCFMVVLEVVLLTIYLHEYYSGSHCPEYIVIYLILLTVPSLIITQHRGVYNHTSPLQLYTFMCTLDPNL